MSDEFDRQLTAIGAASDLMAQAREVCRLYKLAGMQLPPAIARMVGDSSASTFTVSSPDRPQSWQEGWIWLSIKQLSAPTLVLGLIKKAGGRSSPKAIIGEICKLRPDVNTGSFYNAATRLIEQKLLKRDDGDWWIVDDSKAPEFHNNNAWGPFEAFAKYDHAAYRREMICQIISDRGPQMVMQIVKALDELRCQAPHTKGLVKADMIAMAKDGRVKRVGNSRKYVIADSDAK